MEQIFPEFRPLFHYSIIPLFHGTLPEHFHGRISMEVLLEVMDTPDKKRKQRSWLWEYFTTETKNVCKCKTCSELIDHEKGTNSMKHHMKSKHQITQEDDDCRIKKQAIEFNNASSLTLKLYDSLL